MRMERMISGEYDEGVNERFREQAMRLRSVEDFHSLPVWLACYIVYGRHSEAKSNRQMGDARGYSIII